ncbi:hypothetical protein EDD21DRAFT_416938 [Dissophora ornata]|nr:hypothetical protein EDD21DRAFT_416938 [Dissophora ornata]
MERQNFNDVPQATGWTEDGDSIITGQGQHGEPVVQRLLSDSPQPGSPELGDRSFYCFGSQELDSDDGKENVPPQSQQHDQILSQSLTDPTRNFGLPTQQEADERRYRSHPPEPDHKMPQTTRRDRLTTSVTTMTSTGNL